MKKSYAKRLSADCWPTFSVVAYPENYQNCSLSDTSLRLPKKIALRLVIKF